MKIGIRCLKCNTDIWASELAIQFCKCGSVNIGIDRGSIIKGCKKGTSYELLKDDGKGNIETIPGMDTTRAPVPKMDERNATRRTIREDD